MPAEQLRGCSHACRRFQHDLEDAIQHIQDPHALKEAMKKLYQRHCSGTLKHSGLEEEVQSEYTR